MITSNMYKGLMAFSLFIDDYKSRGHSVNPALYGGLVFMWFFVILFTPITLWMDFCIWLVGIFMSYYEKKQPITKQYKRRRK